jgi:TonB family protein
MRRTGLLTLLLLVVSAARPTAQDPLAAARDLYAAANYEDALSMLNQLRTDPGRSTDRPRIEQYRAFCLLALGRSDDAAQAIAALVSVAPSYQPSDAEVSPRIRSAFTDVRRRVLPGMVQEWYSTAKQAYDRREFADAAAGFREVLDVMSDPDVAPAAALPPLSDIRTLAAGFYELAIAAAMPPPAPPPPAAAPPPPPPAQPEAPAPPRVYTIADHDVVAPVAVRQWLPPYPQGNQVPVLPSGGVLEVVIGENGQVERASMRMPINPMYDRMVLAAAREWLFVPAKRAGGPVKFRKMIQIEIKR